MGVIKFPGGSDGPDPTEGAPVEKKYVEPAETQYTNWKGTVSFDDPHLGSPGDVFGFDRERFGPMIAFSLFGGLGKLDFRATVYTLADWPASKDKKLEEIAAANDGEIPVVRVEYVEADVEKVMRSFKQFHIVAQPAGLRRPLRVDRIVNLGEEEEED